MLVTLARLGMKSSLDREGVLMVVASIADHAQLCSLSGGIVDENSTVRHRAYAHRLLRERRCLMA